MVALPPLGDALHDMFLCVGLGFFTAVFYTLLRFVLGKTRAGMFAADVVCIVAGAFAYFALSVQGLHTGVLRWYTGAAVLAGHFLCLALWGAAAARLRSGVLCALAVPMRLFCRAAHHAAEKRRKKRLQKCTKKRGRKKKPLQKVYKVLYNSKYEA